MKEYVNGVRLSLINTVRQKKTSSGEHLYADTYSIYLQNVDFVLDGDLATVTDRLARIHRVVRNEYGDKQDGIVSVVTLPYQTYEDYEERVVVTRMENEKEKAVRLKKAEKSKQAAQTRREALLARQKKDEEKDLKRLNEEASRLGFVLVAK